MQHEITQAIPLLDEQGELTQPGWARRLLPVYDRSKERDCYLVMNRQCALAITISDNRYMGMDSISLIDLWEGWQVTRSPMRLMPLGGTGLPQSSLRGSCARAGRGYGLLFQHEGEGRTLHAHMDRFRDGQALDAQILLTQEPEESIVMCTPFEKPGQFYFNQKINCMRAQGKVTLGDREYVFDPEDSFAVLDWGRGVWTCRSTWYWGSASGMVDGVPFGFNIGSGFGDTSAATENALFYGGKLHKLSQVTFHIPRKNGREHYLAPWTFDSDDRRFRMKFRPILDRAACPSAGVVRSGQHQVFGSFTGTAVLDDGTAVRLKELLGFAEKVDDRW
mgnify:FL=1